jgi:hypothetical protein
VVEEEEQEEMDVKIDNVPTTTLPDPGWDVNATGVTLPQWGKDKVFFLLLRSEFSLSLD